MTTFRFRQSYFKELVIEVKWAQYNENPPQKIIFSNPFTVCWLILDGTRTIELDNKNYRVYKDDLIFIPANSRLQILDLPYDHTNFRYAVVAFNAKFVGIDITNTYEFPIVSHLTNYQQLLDIWDRLINQIRCIAKSVTKEDEIHLASSLVTSSKIFTDTLGMQGLLFLWFQQIMTILLPVIPEKIRLIDKRIIKVCSYIEQNLDKPIKLNMLAKHVYLSPSRLNILFKESLGMPPFAYALQMRINKAKELLIDTSLSLRQISILIGFQDQSQFSRAFHKAEGINPLTYRNNFNTIR